MMQLRGIQFPSRKVFAVWQAHHIYPRAWINKMRDCPVTIIPLVDLGMRRFDVPYQCQPKNFKRPTVHDAADTKARSMAKCVLKLLKPKTNRPIHNAIHLTSSTMAKLKW